MDHPDSPTRPPNIPGVRFKDFYEGSDRTEYEFVFDVSTLPDSLVSLLRYLAPGHMFIFPVVMTDQKHNLEARNHKGVLQIKTWLYSSYGLWKEAELDEAVEFLRRAASLIVGTTAQRTATYTIYAKEPEDQQPTELYTCPCCGYRVFDEPPGSYDICPICFWEDDDVQLRFPLAGGANKACLAEAQANFVAFGACEARVRSYVRKPQETDVKDAEWRPLRREDCADTTGMPTTGMEYFNLAGETKPRYYWKPTTEDT